MPKMPDPVTGLLDPDDDPFKHCTGRFPHQRQQWTLADDYTIGKAYFRFSLENGISYVPKGRAVNLKDSGGDR